MKGESVIVYDPRGIVDAAPQPLAPRVRSLKGLRLGVLDNTKWNANRLLKKTATQLQQAHGLGSVSYYRKESFSKDADPELIKKIAQENDVILTAIGD